MGIFDFLKKKNVGIEESKFNSQQFQNEICALALWKLEEKKGNPDVAFNELKKIGLSDDQIALTLKKANQFINVEKQVNTNKIGIESNVFKSDNFQTEILDNSFELYFKNKHSYDAVKQDLQKKGLNAIQTEEILSKLKIRINAMVDDFQSQLDSGVISEIKIKPNIEHKKGGVDSEQIDKYIAYGAYQMERGDFENALELFDKAIELDENATLAYANKGTLYSKKEEKTKALEFYNKALELEPNHLQILETKMDLLFEIMNDSNEIEFINTAKTILENDSNHPNALIYVIQYYIKQNEMELALDSAKKLFSNFHTESISTHLLLEILYKISNEKALIEFEKFAKEIREDAKYQLEYTKGLYLMRFKEEYEKSIKIFEDLNNLQEFSWNYYQIAIIKNFQNKTDECLELLKSTFALEPELKEDAKQIPYFQNLKTNKKFIELTE